MINTQKVWEYTKAIILALILALLIRTFIVQAFKIPSGSMIPTLLIGDHLLVNKFIYGTVIPFTDKRVLVLERPRRGDIIVFKFPEDPDRDFIKRIVAGPGDTVELRQKQLYVNDQAVDEPYAQYIEKRYNSSSDPRDNFGPYLVPEGKYFVMGDNRDQSYDSRYWGYVDMKDIKGKALIIYWSWDSKRSFPRFDRIGQLIK